MIKDEEAGRRPSYQSSASNPGEQYANYRDSLAEQVQTTRQNLLSKLDMTVEGGEADLTSGSVGVGGRQQSLGVYLRIRPADQTDQPTPYYSVDEKEQTFTVNASSSSAALRPPVKGDEHVDYAYSRIFGPDAEQAVVYDIVMAGLTEAAVRGQNALLFAYGVTNSGKTYTIQGTPDAPGLLPRALNSLFSLLGDRLLHEVPFKPALYNSVKRLSQADQQALLALRDKLLATGASPQETEPTDVEDGARPSSQASTASSAASLHDSHVMDDSVSSRRFLVFCSFVEIYNGYVYDLLVPTLRGGRRPAQRLGEDKDGATYIKDLREFPVFNASEAAALLAAGQRNLRFGSTSLNASSSRSHCIFTVRLMHVQPDGDEPGTVALMSRLSVCDLAGSERSRRTNLNSHAANGHGAHIKETSSINTSLGALRMCIVNLRHNQMRPDQPKVVPYRDSSVTRVLQPFFTSNARVNMIVNIHPGVREYDETIHVLKFSSLVRRVRVQPGSTREPKQLDEPINKSIAAPPAVSAHTTMDWKQLRQSIAPTSAPADLTQAEDEMDEFVEQLQTDLQAYKDYAHQLKQMLIEEKRKNKRQRKEIEQQVRDEVCGEYTKMIHEMQDEFSRRQTSTQAIMEDLADRRIQLYVNSAMKAYNRPGSSSSDVDSDATADEDDDEQEQGTPSAAEACTPRATQPADNGTPIARPTQNVNAEIRRLSDELQSMRAALEQAQLASTRLEEQLADKERERQDLEQMLTEAGEQFTKQELTIQALQQQMQAAAKCDLMSSPTLSPSANGAVNTPATVVRMRPATAKNEPTANDVVSAKQQPSTNPYHRPASVVVYNNADVSSSSGFVSAYSHVSSMCTPSQPRTTLSNGNAGSKSQPMQRMRKSASRSPYKAPEFHMTRQTAQMLTRAVLSDNEELPEPESSPMQHQRGNGSANNTSVWSPALRQSSPAESPSSSPQSMQHQPLHSTMRESGGGGYGRVGPPTLGDMSPVHEHRQLRSAVKIQLNDSTVQNTNPLEQTGNSTATTTAAETRAKTTSTVAFARPSTNKALSYYHTMQDLPGSPLGVIQLSGAHAVTPNPAKKLGKLGKSSTLPYTNRAYELRRQASPSVRHNHDTGSLYHQSKKAKSPGEGTGHKISRMVKRLISPAHKQDDVFSSSGKGQSLAATVSPRPRVTSNTRHEKLYSRRRRSLVKKPKLYNLRTTTGSSCDSPACPSPRGDSVRLRDLPRKTPSTSSSKIRNKD